MSGTTASGARETSKVTFHWDEEGAERKKQARESLVVRPSKKWNETDTSKYFDSTDKITDIELGATSRSSGAINGGGSGSGSSNGMAGLVSEPTGSVRLNMTLHRSSSFQGPGASGPSVDNRVPAAFQIQSQELSLRLQNSLSKKGKFANEFYAIDQPDKVIRDLTAADKENLETDLHIIGLDELGQRFQSDLNRGLTDEQVVKNRVLYGDNILTPSSEVSPLLLFAKQLISGFNFLLWIATIVIFLSWYPLGQLNGLTPATVNVAVAALLLVVIFVSGVFQFWMELRAINIIRSFADIAPAQAHVKRNGKDVQIPASELVVGDLVTIAIGEKVPADVRLITVNNFQVNNSALTGESEPISCGTTCTNLNYMESLNLCFYGSLVPQGSAVGVVIATGDQTVMGQIHELTQSSFSTETSLHREMLRFVGVVAIAALITAIVILIVWLAYLYPDWPAFMPPANFVLNLISLIVAYVPEGLPVCVTVTLTLIAKRMYYQHVLVRNLSIVETFNSVSMIASDKTGTLTMNQMTVTNVFYGLKKSWSVPPQHTLRRATDFSKEQQRAWSQISSINTEPFRLMVVGAALCNSARVQTEVDASKPDSRASTSILGDAADTSLYHLLQQQLFTDPEEVRLECPKLKVLPFNSANKFMAVWVNLEGSSLLRKYNSVARYNQMVFIKGAPEILINRCTTAILENDANDVGPVSLTSAVKAQLLARQEDLGRKGLRVIAICCQAVDRSSLASIAETHDEKDDMDGFPVGGYCFLGMFGLLDPPRSGVAEAVLKAHQAGIRVAMVTGDHSTTAGAIAKQVNIIPRHIMDNDVFRLRLGADGIGRAVLEILQDDKQHFTHVIGSKKKTDQEKDKGNGNGDDNDDEQSPSIVRATSIPDKERSWWQRIFGTNTGPVEPRKPTIEAAALITGADLKLFDDFMWKWALSHRYLVFCRTSPEQKLKIVSECQAVHEIVAVTGDGTNDAPALKKSDLGIAMQAGADVAREAGDMVLLDNNFASIIDGIETGRVVSDNLRKVCLYLMVGGTYSEMWAVMTNVVFGVPLPLASFQMIIVSIGTDILDALALVQEQPEEAIMNRPPIDRRLTAMVDRRVVIQAYGFYGTICTFSAMLCYFWYMQDVAGLHAECLFFAYTYGNVATYTCAADSTVQLTAEQQTDYLFTAQSVYFVSLLIVNWFQMFATRTRYSSILQHNPLYGRGQNLWLFAAVICGIGACVFVLNVQWFNDVFGTRPVPIKHVCPAIGFGALLLLFDECRKWHIRSNPNGFCARIAW